MIWIAALLVLILAGVFLSRRSGLESTDGISPEELRERMKTGPVPVIVDVRTPAEFQGPLNRIAGAISLPLADLDAKPDRLVKYRDRDLVVVCLSGARSRKAAEILSSRGFSVKNLTGGLNAWNRLGFTMAR